MPAICSEAFFSARSSGSMPFAIGGHRGSGENLHSHRPGQTKVTHVRENTLKSFRKAAQNGAHFIEFDVQVTSDGVAVIFHDDYIVHGSLCDVRRSLVRQVTYSDFQAMGGPRPEPSYASDTSTSTPCGGNSPTANSTANSTCSDSLEGGSPRYEALLRSFKCKTTHAKLPGDRVWDCEEEDSMPTLAQLFTELPESLGFNIEVKMSTSPALERTPALEIDRMLDAILPVVQRHSEGPRAVMFSSFDPDVVAALAARALSAQVWLLSTCGQDWHSDARRMSVPAAVAFAREHALIGLVLDSDAVWRDGSAVSSARDANLLVMTYGARNDEGEWVLAQRRAGVAGVIVDDVVGAVSAVTNAQAREAEPPAVALPPARASVPDLVRLTGTAC